MNYLKTDPIGIDYFINRIQDRIYDPLVTKWGEFDSFGRVYKKTSKSGVSLERYVGKGQYKKVLFSEGNKMFFVQGSSPSGNGLNLTNDLWIVCILDIENIKGVEHRADEEVHQDLITELSKVVENDSIQGVEYGMNNLKRVVEDSFEFGNFKYSDIHPYHVFMVKIEAKYSLVKNNCK